MIADEDLTTIRKWIDHRNVRIPVQARDQLRIELDVSDRHVTIQECRPPWNLEYSTEWTRLPVARIRYYMKRSEWSLYWVDRNSDFHEYELVAPSSDVNDLLAEIDADPTYIFWG